MTDTMRAFIVEQEHVEGFSLPVALTYLAWLALIATIYPLCSLVAGPQAAAEGLVAVISATHGNLTIRCHTPLAVLRMLQQPTSST